MKELYKLVGLSEDVTLNEVKLAKRDMFKKFHPDNGGNEEEFKKKNEAYTKIIEYLNSKEQLNINSIIESLYQKKEQLELVIFKLENQLKNIYNNMKKVNSELEATNQYIKNALYNLVYFKLNEIAVDIDLSKRKIIKELNTKKINSIFQKKKLNQLKEQLNQYKLIEQNFEIIFSFCTYKMIDENKFYQAMSFIETTDLEYKDKILTIRDTYENNKEVLNEEREHKKRLIEESSILKKEEENVSATIMGKKTEYGSLKDEINFYSNNEKRR